MVNPFLPICLLIFFLSLPLKCVFMDSMPDNAYNDYKKGMNIFFMNYRNKYEEADFKSNISELKGIGITTLFLVPYYFCANETDNVINSTRETIPISQLDSAISICTSYNIEVILKPHIDLINGVGRYKLSPSNLEIWCQNYWEKIKPLCFLAQEYNHEYFVLATELDKIINTSCFSSIIDSTRTVYKGKLIYASSYDHFLDVSIWDKIDVIGINAYYNLNNNKNCNLAVFAESWNYWLNIISDFSTQMGKKVIITETGFFCNEGVGNNPGDWTCSGDICFNAQAVGYESLLMQAYNFNNIIGIFWWQWELQNSGGLKNYDYTPKNKPAEDILRKYWKKNK